MYNLTIAALRAQQIFKDPNAIQAKFIKGGNIKVGSTIFTFSKLAGNSVIDGCKGSCGKYGDLGCWCSDDYKHSPCYVVKSYIMYNSVVQRHKINTVCMREDLKGAFRDLDAQIRRAKNKPTAIRIHSSGELESKAELMGWIKLAEKWPDIPFYCYTKNTDVVDEVMEQLIRNKKKMLRNFYINISIWEDCGRECFERWKGHRGIRAFVYDNGYDYGSLKKDRVDCPAYVEGPNGKTKLIHNITCDKCKLCLQDKHKVVFCRDH